MPLRSAIIILSGLALSGTLQEPSIDTQIVAPVATKASDTFTSTDVDDSRISLHFRNAKPSEVFAWLESHGINFVASSGEFSDDARITLNLKDEPIETALNAIARALGGRWERDNGVRIFKRRGAEVWAQAGPLSSAKDWAELSKSAPWAKDGFQLPKMPPMPPMPPMPSMPKMPAMPPLPKFDDRGMNSEDWQKKYGADYEKKIKQYTDEIQKKFGPEYQKRMEEYSKKLQEKFGPEYEKKMKLYTDEQNKFFGPEYQKKMKEYEQKFQKEFGPEFQKEMKDWSKQFDGKTFKMDPFFLKNGNLGSAKDQADFDKLFKQSDKFMKEFNPRTFDHDLFKGKKLEWKSDPMFKLNGHPVDVKAFLKTLTPDQKDKMSKRGYIWWDDLTGEQKEALGGRPGGKFEIKYKIDDDEIAIRGN